ncbi:MAG: hypothetical protein DME07_10580 [Candidatus Rokuibacteriota bacterium]|nr:MAG: hypothetical protein DME07_10580 [Candidatus Rokubacteria bacterium]PYN14477.1 MAG: hypothetical protein DME05_15250 [Candidatus Rokubacteria bacterium]PYN57166.1 MAG: hypothetical protein DMD94_05175 [Candidatus Rokubacteria bacterium]PYN76780.1 MAG: hypothetical protein DMD97_11170 [Candidatus Rokubacteria bacterium]
MIGPTRKGVPNVVSALVPVLSGSRVSSMSALSAALSATSVLRAPRTTTALRFLLPRTAPMPPRPETPSRLRQ